MRLRDITELTTIADRLLIIAIILLCVSGFIFVKRAFPQGKDVRIEVDGKTVYRLPLNAKKIVRVDGVNGATVVEIRDRKVSITESACPNKTCIHNGWIDRGAIVCLPNRVVVIVGSDEKSSGLTEEKENKVLDAVTR